MFKLSKFGEKFSQESGIVSLMDDLGTALNENPELIFMGGGNPARIPEIEDYFHQRLKQITESDDDRFNLLSVYQSPQGELKLRKEMASYLSRRFNWQITEKNIAFANGSQSAFFTIYNILAGEMPNGENKKIHFPLAPEYVGYANAGLSERFFSSTKPDIELIGDDMFKYHVNFEQLNINENIAALSVSRPTNPTGNVLTDEEINQLDAIAQQHNIPLIIDGAYGLPFPNITFVEAKPHWNDNTILVLSLSKLGLPAVRTGIVIANEEFIGQFTRVNTICNLATSSTGPTLISGIFNNNEITTLTETVRHYYRTKVDLVTQELKQALAGIPYRIHVPEGAIFIWLWLQDLPITSNELYQKLKSKGVLVIPGEEFFIGLDDWQHKKECIRISYAQSPEKITAGINIIQEELKALYPFN
ncbi:valine--pyruvate transaminase [Colwellia sp. MSW7]|uniref:Valine--pyruvate transaminase n=1 Tax=Colwellia maritima TaxID=2912588 RepID=A0ABS9X3M6_9GAMM|nr:valine--pyruvate transaminase [Colwellia maritima]MCI2284081.1 valine--pyruvate transaminase [Colwellia maritima]